MKYVLAVPAALLGIAVLYYVILFTIPFVGGEEVETPTPTTTSLPQGTSGALSALFMHTETPPFSFSYPLFEHWETESNEREIRYEPGEALGVRLARPPSIQIDFVAISQDEPFMAGAQTNPHGIPYKDLGYEASRGATRFVFDVGHPGGVLLEIYIPKDETQGGFSGKIISDTIIGTLRKH